MLMSFHVYRTDSTKPAKAVMPKKAVLAAAMVYISSFIPEFIIRLLFNRFSGYKVAAMTINVWIQRRKNMTRLTKQ